MPRHAQILHDVVHEVEHARVVEDHDREVQAPAAQVVLELVEQDDHNRPCRSPHTVQHLVERFDVGEEKMVVDGDDVRFSRALLHEAIHARLGSHRANDYLGRAIAIGSGVSLVSLPWVGVAMAVAATDQHGLVVAAEDGVLDAGGDRIFLERRRVLEIDGFAAAALPVCAQTSALNGVVSDESGAVVPGATVVVTSTAMGTKVTSKTAENGFYQATFLIPGTYTIEASAAGCTIAMAATSTIALCGCWRSWIGAWR